MQFNKPPVVEAWIEFKFALTDEASIWDEEAARKLMRDCYGAFDEASFIKCTELQVSIKEGTPDFTVKEEFLDRIKAFSQEGDQCIQARRDAFVFNQLKKDSWRGYGHLRDAALEAVGKYIVFRDLHELTGVGLHYRDVVAVPRVSNSGIKLGEWFRIYPEVPEEAFGTMSGFRFSVQLPELCQGARALVSVQSVPPETEDDTEIKFSIDWHVTSADKIKDIADVRDWLDPVHDSLRKSFDRAFTRECLALFEPDDGE